MTPLNCLSSVSAAILLALTFVWPLAGQESAGSAPQSSSLWVRANVASGATLEDLGLGPTLGASGLRTAALEVGWRLRGDSGWRHEYNGPSLGVGLLAGDVSGRVPFGDPAGAYAFFHWPMFVARRAEVRLELAAGVAGGWQPYDAISNPEQQAIGSPVTALVQISSTVAVHLDDRWGLHVGVSASHFSNGALTQPNRGLTALSPSLGLAFQPGGRGSAPRGGAGGAGASDGALWRWRARLYGGAKAVRVEGPQRAYTHRAAVQGLSGSLHRRLSPKLRAVASADLLHDPTGLRAGSVPADTDLEGLSLDERLSLGASLGLEWVIGRVRLETAWGGAVWRQALADQVRRRYEKFGASVRVREQLEVGLMVRTSRGISDFVELGVGWVW